MFLKRNGKRYTSRAAGVTRRSAVSVRAITPGKFGEGHSWAAGEGGFQRDLSPSGPMGMSTRDFYPATACGGAFFLIGMKVSDILGKTPQYFLITSS
jgi:hypothetical protein